MPDRGKWSVPFNQGLVLINVFHSGDNKEGYACV